MKFENDRRAQPVIQREMPFFSSAFDREVSTARYVPIEIVDSWESQREAIMWCWENRPHSGGNDAKWLRYNKNGDQTLFASISGAHPPHVSNYFAHDSKSPMDMPSRFHRAFTAFTQWRGLAQWSAKELGETLVGEMLEQNKQRRAA